MDKHKKIMQSLKKKNVSFIVEGSSIVVGASMSEEAQTFINDFESKLDGNVYKENFRLPKYLARNGKLIYDFSNIKFKNGFCCSDLNLKTLNGIPKVVGTIFDCSDNELNDIQGGPEQVESSDYSGNDAESIIELAPSITKLYIESNFIKTFDRLPKNLIVLNIRSNHILEGTLEKLPNNLIALDISYNPIISLEGLPKSIKHLSISNAELTSLEGLPNKLDYLDISRNPGEFHKDEVRAVCDVKKLIV